MKQALDYFLDYIRFDTRADEVSDSWPSSAGQKILGRRLLEDLQALGVDASMDENGFVMGFLPSNTAEEFPGQAVLGLIAHLDTSPDMSGADVCARVIEYRGGDIVLDEKGQYVMQPEVFPNLEKLQGKHLVVTDGRTLLGADDKAGVAAIMGLLARFKARPELRHGPLAVAFTPDEEVGRGATRFNVEAFGADFAYTIDGGEEGELESESFNAAAAKIVIKGRNVHPGTAKDKMINAALLARDFAAAFDDRETPQATEGYEGFFHLTDLQATVEEAHLNYIIRDFDEVDFAERKSKMTRLVEAFNARWGEGCFTLTLRDQYRNMGQVVARYPFLLDLAKKAMVEADVTPIIKPIRGGTDGSQLSYMGLPCPNLFTGGQNFHGRYEFLCVESFAKLGSVLEGLCAHFAAVTERPLRAGDAD